MGGLIDALITLMGDVRDFNSRDGSNLTVVTFAAWLMVRAQGTELLVGNEQ